MERAAPEEAVFTAKSNPDPSCPRCRHRIGRTARAGASGVALSLVGPKEMHRVEAIQEAQTRKVDEARGRASAVTLQRRASSRLAAVRAVGAACGRL